MKFKVGDRVILVPLARECQVMLLLEGGYLLVGVNPSGRLGNNTCFATDDDLEAVP